MYHDVRPLFRKICDEEIFSLFLFLSIFPAHTHTQSQWIFFLLCFLFFFSFNPKTYSFWWWFCCACGFSLAFRLQTWFMHDTVIYSVDLNRLKSTATMLVGNDFQLQQLFFSEWWKLFLIEENFFIWYFYFQSLEVLQVVSTNAISFDFLNSSPNFFN